MFKDRLKRLVRWAAAISSAITLQSASATPKPDNVRRNAPLPSVTRPATEYLDYRVRQGALVNGETQEGRAARWKSFKEKNGAQATFEAIRKEPITRIEIPHKDEKGYLFETYEPGKKHVFKSYYPNGVLQAKSGEQGDSAEGFYPDGSRKFVRTSNGVETRYYPGGIKGKEKIMETPHGLLDAYDVLDEEGRRIEHHHAIEASPERKTAEGSYTSRDVKKVDLYNPQTQKIIGTYTLDHWGVSEGRVASIGFVDENGRMKTMSFPKPKKIGDTVYYAEDLSIDQIKMIYKEEQRDRIKKQEYQKGMSNHVDRKVGER